MSGPEDGHEHPRATERREPAAAPHAQSTRSPSEHAEEDLVKTREELERKTAALAASLARLRATLESTTDAILVTDPQGRLTDWNEHYARMWRIPRPLLDAADHFQVIDFVRDGFKDPAQFAARVREIYATAPADSFDVLDLKDGRTVERYSRLQCFDGQNMGRVWSFRDVTRSRRVEETLRDETRVLEILNRTGAALASNLNLQALLQEVTDAATQLSGARFGAFFYNVTDDSGDAFMLFTLSGAPRAAFERFGHPRATPLFAPTFRGEGIIRSDDVLKDPRYGHWEPHHGMPPGHLPVRSYLAVPVISRSSEVIGGLFFGHPEPGVFTERAERIAAGVASQAAIAIDNARLYAAAQNAAEERKQLLESERAARTQAERMNDLKDEFLATLSHELRTPLNAILGWSHILRTGPASTADLPRGLEAIERNARVQTQLIEDLLDMSRITSGKLRLDVQRIEPHTYVEAAVETVRHAAEAKRIRIEKVLDPTAGPVAGDPNRLQQIVWNLLSNAVKFTPKDGKVQVLLERVSSHIEISVSDTGIGIKPEFLPHVFERFRQQDASTTRTFGGLGLGLSIVKHLVELHGGSILVSSPGEDRGTTFVVHLPLSVAHSHASQGERLHPRSSQGDSTFKASDLGGLKLLVVDDDADARDFLERVLAECGATVSTTGSATEALALIERARPDLLVSDIGMPNVDGYELLRRIRALGQARGGRLPAIALTAFARSEDRTRALRAGFLAHVAKPVDPAELVATIASIAGRTASAGSD